MSFINNILNPRLEGEKDKVLKERKILSSLFVSTKTMSVVKVLKTFLTSSSKCSKKCQI